MSQMGDSQQICTILRKHFTAAGREPSLLVELGVHKGETSAALLRTFPQARLFMVDEWRAYEPDHRYRKSGDGCAKLTTKQQDDNMLAAQLATQFAGKRANILRLSTLDAAANFFMGKVQADGVFVDADHTYSAVRDDIAAWWPLVKSGGVLSGHDYKHPRDGKQWGVSQAVEEFVQRERTGFWVSGSCWWSIKP